MAIAAACRAIDRSLHRAATHHRRPLAASSESLFGTPSDRGTMDLRASEVRGCEFPLTRIERSIEQRIRNRKAYQFFRPWQPLSHKQPRELSRRRRPISHRLVPEVPPYAALASLQDGRALLGTRPPTDTSQRKALFQLFPLPLLRATVCNPHLST